MDQRGILEHLIGEMRKTGKGPYNAVLLELPQGLTLKQVKNIFASWSAIGHRGGLDQIFSWVPTEEQNMRLKRLDPKDQAKVVDYCLRYCTEQKKVVIPETIFKKLFQMGLERKEDVHAGNDFISWIRRPIFDTARTGAEPKQNLYIPLTFVETIKAAFGF